MAYQTSSQSSKRRAQIEDKQTREPLFDLRSALIVLRLLGRCARRRGGLLTAVTAEDPRGGELAQLVPDHIFLHENAQELVAVVDLERVAHKFRDDRAGPGPGLDRLLRTVVVQTRDLAEQLLVDEGAF